MRITRLHKNLGQLFRPPHPLPGTSLYVSATLISSLGRGLWVPFSLLYFQLVVGIPLPLVGLGLTLGGACGLLLTPLAGAAVDRFGPRALLIGAFLVLGVASLAYLLVQNFWQFLAVSIVISMAQSCMDPAFSTFVAEKFPPEDRDWWFAYNRSSFNLGVGLGGLLAGGAVSLGGTASYHWLVMLNAVCCLVTGALLFGVPVPGHHLPTRTAEPGAPIERASYRLVLRDRPFLGFLVTQAILCLCYIVLEVALPPFLIGNVHAPAWAFSSLFTINTVMVVLVQVPLMSFLARFRRTRGIAAAGLIYAVSFVLFAAALLMPRALLVPYLIVCIIVYTVAELLLAPTSIGLSIALAPEALRGRYMALLGLATSVSGTIAPLFFTLLLTLNPFFFWLPLAILMVGAAGGTILLERHLPTHTLRSQPAEKLIEVSPEVTVEAEACKVPA